VRYSLILGVLAFFFELIPTIGPILIGLSLALVAVFQGVVVLVEVLVFYVVLNTIESNVLGPRIVGQAVGLPAFVSLVAIVAGAEAGRHPGRPLRRAAHRPGRDPGRGRH